MCNPENKNLTNIKLLVKHFFQSEILVSEIIDWLIAIDGKHLTIIIDGYTETSGNHFINDIIIGHKMLTQCNLIITSRSPHSLQLSGIVNHKAVILGFIKSSQISFIDNVLKGSSSKTNFLNNYMQSNPIINSLCNIPLIMNILLQFVEGGNEDIPKAQTKVIHKYIMKITKTTIITDPIELCVSHLYDQMIKDLSQFAFVAMQEDRLTFTVNEILELCGNHFQDHWHRISFLSTVLELGLLNRIPFEAQENSCCKIFSFCP